MGFVGVAGTVIEGTKVKSEVEHAESNMPADSNQHWIFNRIDNDPNGFFTITSQTTQMLLHGNSEGDAFIGYEHYSKDILYDEDDPGGNDFFFKTEDRYLYNSSRNSVLKWSQICTTFYQHCYCSL